MARIVVRPATREDVIAFTGSCPHTVQAFVGLLDGEPVALGGLSFIKGNVVAFCNLSDEMRKHPKTLHKAAMAVMKAALSTGYRHVFALRDENEPTAPRWLERLGFRPIDAAGMVHRWQS